MGHLRLYGTWFPLQRIAGYAIVFFFFCLFFLFFFLVCFVLLFSFFTNDENGCGSFTAFLCSGHFYVQDIMTAGANT